MRRLLLASFATLVSCRAPEPRPSPLVVAPQSVDGGAIVTVPARPSNEGAPEGCPSRDAIARDGARLVEALNARFGGPWKAEVDAEGRISATPGQGVRQLLGTPPVFEVIDQTFPDLVLGEIDVSWHRGTTFYCRAELLSPKVIARTRHGACIELRDGIVDEVRVDRSRILSAFAPLLVVNEEQAKITALDHATRLLKQDDPHVGGAQLLAECDARRRATSLVWVVDVDTGAEVDTISVDAKTRAVVDAKVHTL